MRGERPIGLAVAVLAACAAVFVIGWAMAGGAGEDQPPVGRYQAVAPDLVLDTATGKLARTNGQVLEPPADPSAQEVGRYSAAGYVTAVTRSVGLDIINRPTMQVDVVKGYLLVDTKTGRVVKQRVYYSQPIQPGDL